MLKHGGMLIMHERFFEDPIIADKVLGRNFYHPIRIKKHIFDKFFLNFDIIYENYKEIAAYKARNAEEHGFWIIAKKK